MTKILSSLLFNTADIDCADCFLVMFAFVDCLNYSLSEIDKKLRFT